jgi:HSP20 family molecular chaperone IbpA
MKSLKAKAALAISLSLLLGFAAGFGSKDLFDKHNSAKASAVMNIPVHKLNGPGLWRVDLDPFLVPVDLSVEPLALPDFVSLPLDVPQIKTIDGAHEIQVIAQVPGAKEGDVDVAVGKDILTINGHKKEQSGDKNKHFSTIEESFVRTVQLPCKVNGDKVKATLKNGVLTVSLPKV